MRGKKAVRRPIVPDPKFGNASVAKLVNYILKDGKKTLAQSIVYDALAMVSEKTKQDPVAILDLALKNVMPSMEVKSKRVGGANYQIPLPVRGERRIMLAFRWMIDAARSKSGRSMASRLADELAAAANNEGEAVRKKMDVQKMAEANRAFAHFAR
ncbi:30S ribosomal protein S7 [Candidatus Uhrbacteria bacterium]|nr:30S ribosomal protein S7 [Candidatus Uhrbacteria bacterium]